MGGLFNRKDTPAYLQAGFESMGWLLSDTVEAYDLWAHRPAGVFRGNVTMQVPGRDCVVLRLHRRR